MRRIVNSSSVIAALCALVMTLSACAAQPKPVPIDDFLMGSWECAVIGGSGAQSDLRVSFEVSESSIKVDQSRIFLYNVTPSGIVTDDGLGGGWDIEVPTEVTEGEDFRAFVTSLGSGGTNEQPKFHFDSGTVIVDSFYQYVLRCERS